MLCFLLLLLDTVSNPCMSSSDEQDEYYPFGFSTNAYIRCNGDSFEIHSCATGSYWDEESKSCAPKETSKTIANCCLGPFSFYPTKIKSPRPTIFYNQQFSFPTNRIFRKKPNYRYRNYNKQPNVQE